MAELVWSLNGKYFKDFGVGISSSDGILGELKPKKQDTKDWSEYNGVALDLTKKPKYEAREFTLSGWIVGADWLTMLNNFNALFGEFRNAGKQRLLLDVFGQKTLVFDVRCEDEIELKKTFKQGKMFGTFNLKLIEHNPIKKILYNANSNLQLAFNTPKWVEVNIDGKIDVYKGTVNINKTLTNRVVTGYNFEGRNLFIDSSFKRGVNDNTNWTNASNIYSDKDPDGGIIEDGFNVLRVFADFAGNKYTVTPNDIVVDSTQYTVSFFTKGYASASNSAILELDSNHNVIHENLISGYSTAKEVVKCVQTVTVLPATKFLRIRFGFNSSGTAWAVFWKPKLEKGNKATDWTPAPEDQHFISIAGNIDEITGLTTNADVLWEKL